MRLRKSISLPILSLLALGAFGHVGSPPALPEVVVSAPATVLSTDTACTVTGTTWCRYGVSPSLTCKKNGVPVQLSFNSITTQSPHTSHVDTAYDVSLTPLGLSSGDVLVWEFSAFATSGPYAGRVVRTSGTTNVQ